MRGGTFGGMLDFAGHGGPALILIIAIASFGVTCAVRGWWGTSRRARRLTTLAAIFVLPVGFVVGGLLLIDGYDMVARLGPAATPADVGYAWRRALSPAIAACVAFCLIAAVAGIGWLREREADRGHEPPPRKPAR